MEELKIIECRKCGKPVSLFRQHFNLTTCARIACRLATEAAGNAAWLKYNTPESCLATKNLEVKNDC